MGIFASWRSSGRVDTRGLLAPPGSAAAGEVEAALDKALGEPAEKSASLRGRKCCGVRRLGTATAVVAAACLGALYPLTGGSEKGVEELLHGPSFEGVVPAEKPFFLHHIGGLCFGRQRVETGSLAGMLHFELSTEAAAASSRWGRGKLFLLVFDDQPRHWGSAQSQWHVRNWLEIAKAANICAHLMDLQNPARYGARSQNETVHVSVRIREHYTRQWHLALLGMDWHPNASLAGHLRYRVRGESALSGWAGGTDSGPASGKCPPQPLETLKELVWDFVMPPQRSSGYYTPRHKRAHPAGRPSHAGRCTMLL